MDFLNSTDVNTKKSKFMELCTAVLPRRPVTTDGLPSTFFIRTRFNQNDLQLTSPHFEFLVNNYFINQYLDHFATTEYVGSLVDDPRFKLILNDMVKHKLNEQKYDEKLKLDEFKNKVTLDMKEHLFEVWRELKSHIWYKKPLREDVLRAVDTMVTDYFRNKNITTHLPINKLFTAWLCEHRKEAEHSHNVEKFAMLLDTNRGKCLLIKRLLKAYASKVNPLTLTLINWYDSSRRSMIAVDELTTINEMVEKEVTTIMKHVKKLKGLMAAEIKRLEG